MKDENIILQLRSWHLQQISETHGDYDSPQNTLIFWNGQDGYHIFPDKMSSLRIG